MNRTGRHAPILAARIGLGVVVVMVVMVGAALVMTGARERAATPAASSSVSSGVPTPSCSVDWGCVQEQRFAAASALLAGQHGRVGIVVRDRRTGAIWRAGEPDAPVWAGSTPKLAFAVALREQARTGQITLDSRAQAQIAAMLSISDNSAADALWNSYGNAAALMTRFRDTYGMRAAGYVTGFPSRWGFVKCTAQDLANLMSYVLETLDSADRTFFVNAMRSVGPVQQWGVWAAGAALRPGVKNGWSIESDDGRDHWITATVGFAGLDERYIVAAMYDQPAGGDSIERGVHVLTDLVATVFGAPVPAPAVVPDDY